MLGTETPVTVVALYTGLGVDLRQVVFADIDGSYRADGNAVGAADTGLLGNVHSVVSAVVIILNCLKPELMYPKKINDAMGSLPPIVLGLIYKAVVSEVAKASDPYTGTYEVELRLIEPPANIVSGLIGKAEITPSQTNEYFVLPVHYIHEADNLTGYVYVVNGNSYQKKKIEIL